MKHISSIKRLETYNQDDEKRINMHSVLYRLCDICFSDKHTTHTQIYIYIYIYISCSVYGNESSHKENNHYLIT